MPAFLLVTGTNESVEQIRGALTAVERGPVMAVAFPGGVVATAAAQSESTIGAAGVLLFDRPRHGGMLPSLDVAPSPAELMSTGSTPTTIGLSLTDPVAFAHVDGGTGVVSLFRGLWGERTIYYVRTGDGWLAGSEIGAMLRLRPPAAMHGLGRSEILWHRWNQDRVTLVEGVHQVLPGELVELHPDGRVERRFLRMYEFAAAPTLRTIPDAVDAVREGWHRDLDLLSRRGGSRVAITLSGGVDSSLILALAREHFTSITALTADWGGAGANRELENARKVAAHLGVEHRAVRLESEDVQRHYAAALRRMQLAPRRVSAIPLHACFEAAAGEHDLVIYGDAADLLFGSGQTIRMGLEQERRQRVAWLPGPVRHALGAVGGMLPGRSGALARALFQTTREAMFARVQVVDYLRDVPEVFRTVTDHPELPAHVVATMPAAGGAMHPRQVAQRVTQYTGIADHLWMIERMTSGLGIEMANLPTMPGSLAAAAQLDPALLGDRTMVKPVLKALLAEYIPREWVYAKKIGFPTPVRAWLSGPLAGEVDGLRARLVAQDPATDWIRQTLLTLPVGEFVEEWWTAISLDRAVRHLGLEPERR